MEDDTELLKQTVIDTVQTDSLASDINNVSIEPAVDEDGEEFLRIVLKMGHVDRDVDAQLETLLERIEQAIAAVDDRYPSVRFLDAA